MIKMTETAKARAEFCKMVDATAAKINAAAPARYRIKDSTITAVSFRLKKIVKDVNPLTEKIDSIYKKSLKMWADGSIGVSDDYQFCKLFYFRAEELKRGETSWAAWFNDVDADPKAETAETAETKAKSKAEPKAAKSSEAAKLFNILDKVAITWNKMDKAGALHINWEPSANTITALVRRMNILRAAGALTERAAQMGKTAPICQLISERAAELKRGETGWGAWIISETEPKTETAEAGKSSERQTKRGGVYYQRELTEALKAAGAVRSMAPVKATPDRRASISDKRMKYNRAEADKLIDSIRGLSGVRFYVGAHTVTIYLPEMTTAQEAEETSAAGRPFGYPVPSVVRGALLSAGAVSLGEYADKGGDICGDAFDCWAAGPSWYDVGRLCAKTASITASGGAVGFIFNGGALRVYFHQ